MKRRLVGIEIEGRELRAELAEYWPARENGKEVGFVTNAIWSPGLKRNIGYVWVPTEISEPGTQARGADTAGAVTGRTTAIPFVDPKKRRPLQ